ncbi:MAG TPA: DMT family transporter [Actinomycetota bacterium]|jgi:drug/metabolite transporter (DMT)-like permease|nr:DMT family transporter [Actinomycetota bacterium]
MTAILLALGSSVGYGVSDFLASRVARRVAPVLLVLYSQALQSVVLLVVVLAASQPYSGSGLAWGTAAGAVGAAGLVAYYHALATGQTAIVAPLASSGAVLPLLVDLARGRLPGPLAMAGLVMVLAGIAVTSLASEERDDQPPAPTWHGPPATRRRARVPRPPVPILLALVAAVLFGLFFVGVDLGSGTAGGSVLWVALGVQLGALPTTLAGALRSRGWRGLGIDDPALLLPVAVLTVLNLSADAFLAYAVTGGDLAVVAVLASLAPVVTAVCAHALTTERPGGLQTAGAALAVLGTLVVSAAQAAG